MAFAIFTQISHTPFAPACSGIGFVSLQSSTGGLNNFFCFSRDFGCSTSDGSPLRLVAWPSINVNTIDLPCLHEIKSDIKKLRPTLNSSIIFYQATEESKPFFWVCTNQEI
ncbi:hypothetical protein ABW19_dt0201805 [Dactylella cylindrospora]|nr:hypothetical protein ABW19_dt0201805 [Dactylella cylindrospora]